MRAPEFWDNPHSRLTRLLSPLSWVYKKVVAFKQKKAHPYQAKIPVICVGNLTVGGTGKTPVCLALADLLEKHKKSFYFLTRGYKGKKQNLLVNAAQHNALDVGDEALLLAKKAPTIVDAKRARGAQTAERAGAHNLILDDGFQNTSLVKTFSFLVVDGKRGFQNQHLLPAGPLREPILQALNRADALIIAGKDKWGVERFLKKNAVDIAVLTGQFMPDFSQLDALKGKQVLAFAGIGQPDKFFDMLQKYGVVVACKEVFPDHYMYSQFDIDRLLQKAGDMPIVTTAKDAVKIPKSFAKNIIVIEGGFVFDNPNMVLNLLMGIVK